MHRVQKVVVLDCDLPKPTFCVYYWASSNPSPVLNYLILFNFGCLHRFGNEILKKKKLTVFFYFQTFFSLSHLPLSTISPSFLPSDISPCSLFAPVLKLLRLRLGMLKIFSCILIFFFWIVNCREGVLSLLKYILVSQFWARVWLFFSIFFFSVFTFQTQAMLRCDWTNTTISMLKKKK